MRDKAEDVDWAVPRFYHRCTPSYLWAEFAAMNSFKVTFKQFVAHANVAVFSLWSSLFWAIPTNLNEFIKLMADGEIYIFEDSDGNIWQVSLLSSVSGS